MAPPLGVVLADAGIPFFLLFASFSDALCSSLRSVSGVDDADPEDGIDARLDSLRWLFLLPFEEDGGGGFAAVNVAPLFGMSGVVDREETTENV